MPRSRTADDKLLACLARLGESSTAELAEALGWSSDNVLLVGRRLQGGGRLRVIASRCAAGAGRPVLLWSLAGEEPSPVPAREAPANDLPALAPDTVLVTPSGHEARVVRQRRSWVTLEYMTGPERFQPATLHRSLVRPFQPGRERPEPVRLCTRKSA